MSMIGRMTSPGIRFAILVAEGGETLHLQGVVQINGGNLRDLRNSSAHGNTQFEAQPFPRHGKDVEVVFPDWRYSIY